MKKLKIYFKPRWILSILAFFISGSIIICQDGLKADSRQFYFPEFIQGSVKLKTGKIIQAEMNYNLLSEKMTFMDNGKVMDLTNPEAVDTVYIMDRKFIFYDNKFLEVIAEMPVSLYYEHTGILISTGKEGPYGTKSQTSGPTSLKKLVNDANTYNLKLPEEYKVRRSFISWIKVDNEFIKISTMNQFLNLFPDKKASLKQFVKTNKIKTTDAEGMKKLVLFCNEK